MDMKKVSVLIAICLCSVRLASANDGLRFADVFTDNMVLQRGKDLSCWGTAPAGSLVEVLLTQSREDAIAFAGKDALVREQVGSSPRNPVEGIEQVRLAYVEEAPSPFHPVTRSVTADESGKWLVTLGEHKASYTPTFLAARVDQSAIAIQNLLIGEVWIASGQSNMEWPWSRDKMWENKGLVFPGLRFAKVRGDSGTPRETFTGDKDRFDPWIVCEDGAVDRISSVAYLFGQYLHRRLKVPVGIINIAEGGSYAREWCSREILEKTGSATVAERLRIYDENVQKDTSATDGRAPSSLFNARLVPIRRLTVAGIIFLQGENEALAGDLPQYVKTFPGVIASCRTALNAPELPFGIISLQGMGTPSGLGSSAYAVAREIHLETHKRTANTGYIVGHDIRGGIHPNWKRPLAERAVYWALRDVYKVMPRTSREQIKRVSFMDGSALVEFETVELDDGKWGNPKPVIPETNDQGDRAGFMIAGENRQWFPGRVLIEEGDVPGLRVYHPLVKKPVAVRYAWDSWTQANLGPWHDPIAPYRTDDWPIVCDDEVYDPESGRPSASQITYYEAHELRNRSLELPLQLAAEESLLLLTKRYAHPKGILISTVSAMQKLVDTFEVESYRTLAPELRMQALYNIPVRYWDRSKYTPARRAKWGWLLERILMLDTLPQEMNMAIDQPGVSAKLAELQTAISALQAELSKLPDPEPMRFDMMLDQVLLEMQKERERLSSEGHDMKKQRNELSQNLF